MSAFLGYYRNGARPGFKECLECKQPIKFTDRCIGLTACEDGLTASVERAFSRRKLVHSRLRANLAAERLDEILFIRYNFEAIMKLPSLVQEIGTIAEEIENW